MSRQTHETVKELAEHWRQELRFALRYKDEQLAAIATARYNTYTNQLKELNHV